MVAVVVLRMTGKSDETKLNKTNLWSNTQILSIKVVGAETIIQHQVNGVAF